jgi:hypothetical protein
MENLKYILSLNEFLNNLGLSNSEILNEKIMGGEASELIFNKLYMQLLRWVCKDIDNGIFTQRDCEVEITLEPKETKLLLGDYLNSEKYQTFKNSSKNKVDYLKDMYVIFYINFVFSGDVSTSVDVNGNYRSERRYGYKLGVDVGGFEIVSYSTVYVNIEDLKEKEYFLYRVRHELQHIIQYLISKFEISGYIHNKNFMEYGGRTKPNIINNKKFHQNLEIEYDARFTEFAYSIRDENWKYLFGGEYGIFSYEKINFSNFAEYLKDYNKQQIYTKLYQLGVTNQNIVNFKNELKIRVVDYLNSLTSILNDYKKVILFDLFIEGEPLNVMFKNFNINPYDFLNDNLKDKFLETYDFLIQNNIKRLKLGGSKYDADYLTMKLKKDKYWGNLI